MSSSIIRQDLDFILEKTKGWDDLKNSRIFLTGGTGFFGKTLVGSYAHANEQLGLNAEMLVLTRDIESVKTNQPSLYHTPGVTWVEGDIQSFEFPDGQITHIIHAASELNSANPKAPLDLLTTTYKGAQRIIKLGGEKKSKSILYTSSGAVYGTNYHRPSIAENHGVYHRELTPNNTYAEAKRHTEMLFAAFAKNQNTEIKIARCFAYIGPHLPLDGHFAASNFLKCALECKNIIINGTGANQRTYMYTADLGVWLWTILLKGKNCRPYNVGSDHAVTIADFARMIAEQSKDAIQVQMPNAYSSNYSDDIYVPDVSRAITELGLGTYHNLEKSIQRTMLHHLEKPRTVSA